jgi:hypothetical protein
MSDGVRKYPQWQGRPIVAEAHVPELEHRAAILEFQDGLTRDDAEHQAHQEYLQDHHRQAAAHHLRGLRAAQASGDPSEARKHGLSYGLHLQALGHDEFDAVPKEIQDLAAADDRHGHYKFKAHRSDRLLLDDHQEGDNLLPASDPKE